MPIRHSLSPIASTPCHRYDLDTIHGDGDKKKSRQDVNDRKKGKINTADKQNNDKQLSKGAKQHAKTLESGAATAGRRRRTRF